MTPASSCCFRWASPQRLVSRRLLPWCGRPTALRRRCALDRCWSAPPQHGLTLRQRCAAPRDAGRSFELTRSARSPSSPRPLQQARRPTAPAQMASSCFARTGAKGAARSARCTSGQGGCVRTQYRPTDRFQNTFRGQTMLPLAGLRKKWRARNKTWCTCTPLRRWLASVRLASWRVCHSPVMHHGT